ncbi:MAG: hypothetical protein P0Y65_17150 [Candidatus Devosia phytovorans]|uniref:DUF2971 domain-containing protein n=1 Tax=Candidatus Devosia phytovorans TaxID=3121372 RepID=A0AAJ5VSF1_9HYPH|nr:hypothetical protein [Devosia sp.]WEK03899.1 MAG: hypothetical protein P0Y65_17150 [Devosia sp.]
MTSDIYDSNSSTGTGSKATFRTGFLSAFFGTDDNGDRRLAHRGRRENVFGHGTDLYHYTSLSGLKGIVEENGFWASDNRFLNDTEENLEGLRLARDTLGHASRRSRISGFASILEGVLEKLSSPQEFGNFVACFSTSRDDLGQWRGYAAGGLCLVLAKPGDGEVPVFFGPEQMPYKAIYDGRQKRVLLLSIIRRFELQYGLDVVAMGDRMPRAHDGHYVDYLSEAIAAGILGFKHEAFKQEAEVRIVLSHRQADLYDGGLRFRIGPTGIIPYLRTGDHNGSKKHGGRLPLKEVVVGPSPRQTLTAHSVETFLRYKGYSATKVTLSGVPYRAP